MNETHFDMSQIKAEVFSRQDRRTMFDNNCDAIYVAMEHLDNFSIKFLAKSFIKEIVNDTIKLISKKS